MQLPAVVQLDSGDLLLRLRVAVPADAVETMLPRFESACRAIVREFIDDANSRLVEVHRGLTADDD